MNYLNYYRRNVNTEDASETISGLSTSMCPDDEMELRIRERMIHFLEVDGPQRKLVKSYSRSAADANMAVPKHLRPYPILKQTVQYLLLEILNRPKVSSVALYEFVNDRLRAVRQDMTIQRLPANHCTVLLEPMIRFYIYFGYKLCECPIKDFDPVLNKKYMLECMKWFLSCCDEIDQTRILTVEQLLEDMRSLHVGDSYMLVCDRVLIESLYILCNLDDVHPLYRYLDLPNILKSHPALCLSYKIAVANLDRNFVKISKLIKRLSPLAYCAVFLHLPTIQKCAIRTMSVAYNNPRLRFPAAVIRQWLHLASDNDVMTLCRHYGLTAENGEVHLMKNNFKDVEMTKTIKNYTHADTLVMDIKYILTYTS